MIHWRVMIPIDRRGALLVCCNVWMLWGERRKKVKHVHEGTREKEGVCGDTRLNLIGSNVKSFKSPTLSRSLLPGPLTQSKGVVNVVNSNAVHVSSWPPEQQGVGCGSRALTQCSSVILDWCIDGFHPFYCIPNNYSWQYTCFEWK